METHKTGLMERAHQFLLPGQNQQPLSYQGSEPRTKATTVNKHGVLSTWVLILLISGECEARGEVFQRVNIVVFITYII